LHLIGAIGQKINKFLNSGASSNKVGMKVFLSEGQKG
jgi:hypothetical protein